MLEIRNLTRRYMTRTAVDNVSLSLEPGRTYALLGPNGSGKTTLMKMIAGLTKPTSGTIEFDGTPVGVRTKAQIAYMPTENYFYNYMSIADAGRYYADFFSDFDSRRFAEALERMELEPKDKIRQLSSGMSAKLRLALILSRDARLMMFDEPLNGVDILTRAAGRERDRAQPRGRADDAHLDAPGRRAGSLYRLCHLHEARRDRADGQPGGAAREGLADRPLPADLRPALGNGGE